MDCLDAVMTRRSIRRYSEAPVGDEVVETLLRAAMAAPSAGNQQPWRFVVVRDPAILRELSAASQYASMLPSAALAIVVCADTSVERHRGFWVQDCSAATQNILLTAHALGLGAVWLGFHPAAERADAAAAVLGLPKDVVVLSIVPIGRPDQDVASADRYDPTYVHADRWTTR